MTDNSPIPTHLALPIGKRLSCAELAAWLQRTPGEVYVPTEALLGRIDVRAQKGDLIKLLRRTPQHRAPWKIREHDTTYSRNWWHRIILEP